MQKLDEAVEVRLGSAPTRPHSVCLRVMSAMLPQDFSMPAFLTMLTERKGVCHLLLPCGVGGLLMCLGMRRLRGTQTKSQAMYSIS